MSCDSDKYININTTKNSAVVVREKKNNKTVGSKLITRSFHYLKDSNGTTSKINFIFTTSWFIPISSSAYSFFY